jgi:hypothetical protein
MKLNFRLFLFFLIPLLIFGCRTTKITSTLVTTPIPIDGNMADWPKTSPVLLADSSVTVRVANDGMNLYLAVETKDPENMLDFRRAGITVWADLKGGKSKQVEIHFPAGLFATFDRNLGGFWQSLTPEEKLIRLMKNSRIFPLIIHPVLRQLTQSPAARQPWK